MATVALGVGTILSLIFPIGEHSTLTEKSTNVYAAEALVSSYKESKLWDGIFETIEQEETDKCNSYLYYYQDNGNSSPFRIMPVSLHYNVITLDGGTFDFEQGGKTPGCDGDDDSTPDYEDVLKKRKRRR